MFLRRRCNNSMAPNGSNQRPVFGKYLNSDGGCCAVLIPDLLPRLLLHHAEDQEGRPNEKEAISTFYRLLPGQIQTGDGLFLPLDTGVCFKLFDWESFCKVFCVCPKCGVLFLSFISQVQFEMYFSPGNAAHVCRLSSSSYYLWCCRRQLSPCVCIKTCMSSASSSFVVVDS